MESLVEYFRRDPQRLADLQAVRQDLEKEE
jgi:hypothetical protein